MQQPFLACTHTLSQPIHKLSLVFFILHQLVTKGIHCSSTSMAIDVRWGWGPLKVFSGSGILTRVLYLCPLAHVHACFQIFHFHLTVNCCWAYLILRLGRSDKIQLMMSSSSQIVTYCLTVRSFFTCVPGSMPRALFWMACNSPLLMAWSFSRTLGSHIKIFLALVE